MPNRTLEPELYEMIRDGDIGRLEEYVKRQEQTVGINITNGLPTESCRSPRYLSGVTYAGDTVLHIAAHFGQRKVAERICRESVSLLWRGNNKSETPLHYAAQAVVTLFIQEATDQEASNLNPTELLRKRNRDGETALYQAVHHEQKHVVEELMRADSNLASIPDEQNTSPLYLATMLSSLPIVTSLVELLPQNASRGAYAGPDGRSALHAAALRSEGFVEQSVRKLPELTKARDNSGRTPLHYGASAGNLPAVRLLLEKDRTSAYIADSSGSFPVHDAAKLGHLEVLKELIMKCPDSDELLDDQGKNFFHLAVEEKRVNVVQWVCKNVMLEKAMNAQDDEGNTPLHLAVKAKDKATFAYLTLSKKVHINWVNRDGLTPLDIACALVKDESLVSQALLIWQNENYVIRRALERIGCSRGINRTNNGENEMDQGMEQEEGGRIERMAQSIAIGSVLVASAAFAAAFSVAEASINIDELLDDDGVSVDLFLSQAHQAFFVLDIAAFLYSMFATLSLMYASSPYMDHKNRKTYLLYSVIFTMSASKFLLGALVTGTCVLLDVNSGIDATDLLFPVALFGLCGIQFLFPTPLLIGGDGPLVARAIAKNIGWKDYIIGRINQASRKRIQHFIVYLPYVDFLLFFFSLYLSLTPFITNLTSVEYTSSPESNYDYPT